MTQPEKREKNRNRRVSGSAREEAGYPSPEPDGRSRIPASDATFSGLDPEITMLAKHRKIR